MKTEPVLAVETKHTILKCWSAVTPILQNWPVRAHVLMRCENCRFDLLDLINECCIFLVLESNFKLMYRDDFLCMMNISCFNFKVQSLKILM